MSTFNGFPAGTTRLTAIPNPFFSELLPSIDHLAELKVTLYAFWYLSRAEGD
ncbi:MAG: primosomal replication protein N, partial [Chloroflexi bacterium]|nr:primosomal replication protein N [Chloroflexota bacterium]